MSKLASHIQQPSGAVKAHLRNALRWLTRSGQQNPFYGHHHTRETLKKLSEMNSGERNPFYGKHHKREDEQYAGEDDVK